MNDYLEREAKYLAIRSQWLQACDDKKTILALHDSVGRQIKIATAHMPTSELQERLKIARQALEPYETQLKAISQIIDLLHLQVIEAGREL